MVVKGFEIEGSKILKGNIVSYVELEVENNQSQRENVKGYLSDSGVNSLSDCDYVWLGDENIEEQGIEKGVGERVKEVTGRTVGVTGLEKRITDRNIGITEDVMGIKMGFDGRLKG